jgi:hypothetical protein
VFWLPNVRPSTGDLHQSSGLPPRNWVDYIVVLRTLIANLLEYDTSRVSGNCRRRAIPAMDRASNAELIMLGARCDRVWQTRHKDECGTGSLPGNHDEIWYRPQSFRRREGRLLIVLASVFRPRVRFSSGGGALADRNPRQAPAAPKTRQVTCWVLTRRTASALSARHARRRQGAVPAPGRSRAPRPRLRPDHDPRLGQAVVEDWLARAESSDLPQLAPSPAASAATSRPSPPDSPCPTAPPHLRARSTRSR